MNAGDAPVFAGWEILEKLGEGGMCSVWRVRPASGEGPERAIKLLHDESDAAAARFADEARLLQRIDHPNVLRIHELHDEARPPWIVMDLLAGRDLEETREEQGPMDPEGAARLMADVASGLARVHALGVRHRDIKPANIMMGHDGVPRLIDFGIARETAKAHVTAQGFVLGTASYLPPEIFEDDDSQAIQDSEVADVYALGQTLCEILTGQPVHSREEASGARVLVTVMKDKLDRPYLDPRSWRPQVPDDLAEIVIAATRQAPAERTPSATALEEALRGWLRRRHAADEAPLTAVNPNTLPPPPGTRERQLAARRTATPAPITRRAAGTAAAGAAGIGIVAGGMALVTLIAAIALVVFAPEPPAAEPDRARAIAATTADAEVVLGRCAGEGTSGEAVLAFVVDGGKARDVQLSSGALDDEVVACLTRRVERMDFPAGPTVAVELPLQFR